MLDLPGYKIFRKISQSARSVVDRGQYTIVKLLQPEYRLPTALSYKQEDKILPGLNLTGVAKAENLENDNPYSSLILEDEIKFTKHF